MKTIKIEGSEEDLFAILNIVNDEIAKSKEAVRRLEMQKAQIKHALEKFGEKSK